MSLLKKSFLFVPFLFAACSSDNVVIEEPQEPGGQADALYAAPLDENYQIKSLDALLNEVSASDSSLELSDLPSDFFEADFAAFQLFRNWLDVNEEVFDLSFFVPIFGLEAGDNQTVSFNDEAPDSLEFYLSRPDELNYYASTEINNVPKFYVEREGAQVNQVLDYEISFKYEVRRRRYERESARARKVQKFNNLIFVDFPDGPLGNYKLYLEHITFEMVFDLRILSGVYVGSDSKYYCQLIHIEDLEAFNDNFSNILPSGLPENQIDSVDFDKLYRARSNTGYSFVIGESTDYFHASCKAVD